MCSLLPFLVCSPVCKEKKKKNEKNQRNKTHKIQRQGQVCTLLYINSGSPSEVI